MTCDQVKKLAKELEPLEDLVEDIHRVQNGMKRLRTHYENGTNAVVFGRLLDCDDLPQIRTNNAEVRERVAKALNATLMKALREEKEILKKTLKEAEIKSVPQLSDIP